MRKLGFAILATLSLTSCAEQYHDPYPNMSDSQILHNMQIISDRGLGNNFGYSQDLKFWNENRISHSVYQNADHLLRTCPDLPGDVGMQCYRNLYANYDRIPKLPFNMPTGVPDQYQGQFNDLVHSAWLRDHSN